MLTVEHLSKVLPDGRLLLKDINFSVGESEFVAIARSILQDPCLLLADEPVANLDPTTSEVVMEHLRSISVDNGISTLAVLHQPDLARKYATRILGVKNGIIIYDGDADISNDDLAIIYGRNINEK